MRHARLATCLALFAVVLATPALVSAQNVSIGVQTSNAQLGIHLGPIPPPVVVVPPPVLVAGPPPGPPVYYAPDLPYNYFVYQTAHYLYHDGRWFRARGHQGPWTAIAITQVPRSILAVSVEHYRNRPAQWEQHGPPPWVHEREKERGWERQHGRGHDNGGGPHGRGHGKD